MDNIYYQFADIINANSTKIFREDLSDYNDFREDPLHYVPLLDPKNHPISIV